MSGDDQERQLWDNRRDDVKGMTDDDLARVRTMLEETERARERLTGLMGPSDRPRAPVLLAALDLLAEVERRRAENTALREIVQAVASGDATFRDNYEYEHCCYCPAKEADSPQDIRHLPDCPVTKARALLAVKEDMG